MSLSVKADLLERNIKLYGWVKLFSIRIYLPLVAIYMVEVGHLTLGQIGITVTVASVVTLLSAIPTGYYADRVSRRKAIILGAVLIAIASMLIATTPVFWVSIAYTAISALGYSFISGALEALMHDTLVALGKGHGYAKISGRAQSFSLVGNVILVGIVPLSYSVDKRLPFVLGAFLTVVFALVTALLVEPPAAKPAKGAEPNTIIGLRKILRVFVNRNTILLFNAIGVISAVYVAYAPLGNLAFKDLGLNPSLIGIVFAGGSIAGAICGMIVHRLLKLSNFQYALLDILLGCGTMLAVGVSRSLWVAIATFLVSMGFWRVRNIVYQQQLFDRFGKHGNKATLISTLDFFGNLHGIWLPLLFVAVTKAHGLYQGFAILGAVTLLTLLVMFGIAVRVLEGKSSKQIFKPAV